MDVTGPQPFALDELPRYRSHKIVKAAPIVSLGEDERGNIVSLVLELPGGNKRWDVPHGSSLFARGKAKAGDFLVRYDNGYVSWSPKQAFQDGYTLEAGAS